MIKNVIAFFQLRMQIWKYLDNLVNAKNHVLHLLELVAGELNTLVTRHILCQHIRPININKARKIKSKDCSMFVVCYIKKWALVEDGVELVLAHADKRLPSENVLVVLLVFELRDECGQLEQKLRS